MRGISQRTEHAYARGMATRETRVEKPTKNPRASAIEMQKLRCLLREAEKVGARKQYDEVERLLIQALTVAPESVEARAELGKLYLLMDRDAKSEALYRELLHDTKDVSFYANLALACYKQGKFEQACVEYQHALDLDPKNPERAFALGRSCIAAKRFLEASKLLEHAAERIARDPELLRMLGECYEQLGDLANAENAYERLHRLQPYDTHIKEKLASLASA